MSCGNGYDMKKMGCPFAFGMAFGLTCAIFMAVCAWVGWYWGFGAEMIAQHGAYYYGYAPSLVGGLWGALWGFLKGFIFGFLVMFFFNLFMCCKSKCCKSDGVCSGDKK